jgi:hypothetical protein
MNLKRKSFIWAHNEHINKRNVLPGSNIINLGRHLKIITKTIITCRIDFGTGKIKGYVLDKKGKLLENISHRKPFKKTYANTLNVEKDIYFVDLENAFNNDEIL